MIFTHKLAKAHQRECRQTCGKKERDYVSENCACGESKQWKDNII